jgi:outer membrane lipoprotein-sorting protein
MKPKIILCLALVLSNVATITFAQSRTDSNLTPQEIVQKTMDAYAALSSYSDTGTTVESETGKKNKTTTFNIRLQRPNLFWVTWKHTDGDYTTNGIWWSDNDTNFAVDSSYLLIQAAGQETNDDPAIVWMPFALGITETDAGQVAIIPTIFLKLDPMQTLAGYTNATLRDGKIGNVDCYVLSTIINPIPKFHIARTTTQLWIGKQDYLLRQIKSTDEVTLTPTSKARGVGVKSYERVVTQTHENISMNQKFSIADFELKRKVSPPVFSPPVFMANTNPPVSPWPNLHPTNFTVTVLSAEFGMGKNVVDVTARVAELVRGQPKAFVVNAQTLGQDPLPGKKKRLVIHYVCDGFTNVFTIPAGYSISEYGLVDDSDNKHPRPDR